MISSIHSSLSALHAFEKKQESIADNTANVNTDGFKKTRVTFQSESVGTVAPQISKVDSDGPMVYEQTADGYLPVEKSNVEIAEEIPRAMVNTRSYEANLKTIQTADEMMGSLLDVRG